MPSTPSVTVVTPLTEQLPQVIRDVVTERDRQIKHGYTPQHDDSHGFVDVVEYAQRYLHDYLDEGDDLRHSREQLVKGIATLVAAVEVIDRDHDEDR